MPGRFLTAAKIALLGVVCVAEGSAPATDKPGVKLIARAFVPGEVILVVVESVPKQARLSGSFLGDEIGFFEGKPAGTWLALAPVDLDAPVGETVLEVSGGEGMFRLKKSVRIEKKEFPVRRLNVNPKYVQPDPADLARAARETERLRELYALRTPERHFDGTFVRPSDAGLGARFGERRFFNKEARNPHNGVDLNAKEGTPVRASGAGKVALAADLFFSGRTVVLDHGLGLYTFYIHLSETTVKEGEFVRLGAPIGKVGATGRATGPHLHWGVKLGGRRVDPLSLSHLDLDRWLPPRGSPEM